MIRINRKVLITKKHSIDIKKSLSSFSISYHAPYLFFHFNQSPYLFLISPSYPYNYIME